jgi:hypothetical protein
VAARPSGGGEWTGEARITVEAASCPQADEDLARASLKPPLQLDGIVARVEDEQGDAVSGGGSSKQCLDLLRSHRVRFLVWTDALHAYRGGPALAYEVELGDELVSPACDDGLTRGVPRRMVVEAALGTALGIAAIPHAHVHGKDGRLIRAA